MGRGFVVWGCIPKPLSFFVPTSIHCSSCNSVAHVPTPALCFLSASINHFPGFLSFSLRAQEALAACPAPPPFLLALPPPPHLQASQNSRLLLPVFWFGFLPLTSSSLHWALKPPPLSLTARVAFLFFSTSPSSLTAKCILCLVRFSSCFFLCLLLIFGGGATLLPFYISLFTFFSPVKMITFAPTIVSDRSDPDFLALFSCKGHWYLTKLINIFLLPFFFMPVKISLKYLSMPLLTRILFLAPPLPSLCSDKGHSMVAIILP